MVREPDDAPVPEKSKKNYYIGLVVAILIGAVLVIFVLPNLYFLTDEGPAVDDVEGIVLPDEDGLVDGDGDPIAPIANE
ncbi:hypothetical protein MWU52_15785 [Jannaschia sp. S6380]|uniref:hypothetical protein n=1 Tax=Jannaschia sp. S6380 TaxID=2926408 RepID=UPI001FF5E5E3|nr:hypothetical protein [Jannaschia sp. S6380]MCK0169016.1 hypothetical protein [Jannaschia sp. S6380]